MGHAVKVVCFTFFLFPSFLCYLDDILYGRYDGILWILKNKVHRSTLKHLYYRESGSGLVAFSACVNNNPFCISILRAGKKKRKKTRQKFLLQAFADIRVCRKKGRRKWGCFSWNDA